MRIRRIFISSTPGDLLEYRRAVRGAINGLGQDNGIELWASDDSRGAVHSVDRVKESDALILLLAHRYGTIPDGERCSITELEYLAARDAGIPVLAFFVDPEAPWPPQEIEWESRDQLQKFKERVEREVTRKQFRTPQELAVLVKQALAQHLPRPVQTTSTSRFAADPKPVRSASTASTIPRKPATKYRPPAAVRSLVARERLMAILREAGRRRLILIYAPSGYGKTTLVAQWRAELTSAGVAVGWLTVDSDDNNAVWFLAHVLEAIRRIRPTLAASLGEVLEARGEEAARYVLTSLIDEIDESGDPLTLVIDDWQRVSDTQTTDALRFLIDHGGEHLQIIVTSWSRAQLPLGRLRVRDELVEIDCEKLRFDAGETQSLFNDIAGLELAGDELAALTASTDGWAAALQLATLSLRGGGDAGSLLSRMSGDDEEISEFLAENVLDTLEPELVEFMLATSITERTCGELASAVAGVSDGQTMLEDVERRGLFLQRIDDDPQWFHYHQMAAGFLRRRLERDNPDLLKRLHRAASLWFGDHDYFSEAVDHALAAGDATLAIAFAEQVSAGRLTNQSQMTTFLGALEKLPPQLATSRPQVQLSIAWANLLLWRHAATEAALDRFTAAMSKTDLPEVRRANLTVEADVLRAVAETHADRFEALADLVAEAMSRPDALRPSLPHAAALVLAIEAIYRFDFQAAHRLLEWAEPYREHVGAVGTVYAHCWAGLAARQQLDIPRALRSFREAFEIAAVMGPHSYAVRLAGALLGELLYETGELTEAADLVDQSYLLGPEAGTVEYLAARYGAGAKIKAAQGDPGAAASRLDEGMAVAEKLRLPRLAAAINHERVRLRLPITASEAARLRAERTIPHAGDGIATITAELDEASGIRLLARSDDHEQACRRAEALLAGIDPIARPLTALQARLQLVETLTAAGRAADAGNDIAVVSTLCAEHGLPRLLIDAGLG